MSITKKIGFIFTILVLLILVTNNTIHYFRLKDNLVYYHEREISLISKLVSYQINNAKEGSLYVEDIIANDLHTASIAIRNALPAKHEDVTNEQLIELANELKISDITLLKKGEGYFIGVKSTDPHEINITSKNWNYWNDALNQLYALQTITVGKGIMLPNYWSGPIEVSSSNPSHLDKWGYYYDGSKNYIINPNMAGDKVLDYEQKFGPTDLMTEILTQFDGVLELTVFNPKNFGKQAEFIHSNGNSYIPVSSQPIWYGEYKYQNEQMDAEYIEASLDKNEILSYEETINHKNIKRTFAPVTTKLSEPYVIGFTYDYDILQKELKQELVELILSSIGLMFIVLLLSLIFSKSLTRPISNIMDHVNNMAEGDFDKQLEVDRKDELGHLASNLNGLSKALKTYTNDLEKSQELIMFHAYHDPLTSLPNRRYFQEKFAEWIDGLANKDQILAVLFIDIDRFKQINDSMGHNVGDLLIQEISKRITATLSNYTNIVTRQGGDEFIILLRDVREDAVEAIANELVDGLRETFHLQGKEIYIGASCGISYYPRHTTDMDTLIVNADIAMYAAKQQGGNNVSIFDMNCNKLKEKLLIEERLRKAIQEEALTVHYQPKIKARTGKIIGVEALVRWEIDEFGHISPATFIPIAEEIGLIQPLFELVLRKALKQMKAWNNERKEKMTVSVNVSAKQFLAPNQLVSSVKYALKEIDFPPELLEIEITESTFLTNLTETIHALEEFSHLGIMLSVDDFGTGYSSLNYLKQLPINYLKIEQTFIQEIDEDGANSEIASAIIHLARSLKLGIIAEGVEKEHQKQFLLENGCIVMQGYLFYKPLAKEEFEKVLNEQ